MGLSQSIPRDSPLVCVKWNLKPLLLIDLKVHKLESLCTKIWPQYKLDNQNRWPAFITFNFSILSDLTNFLKRNGKRLEVPHIQAFWDLRSCPLCKDCSTYQILLYSLSLSITKESKSKAPKRPTKPSAPKFDPADKPPPYSPRDETTPSSPSSSKTGSNDSETPRDDPTPFISQDPKQTHVSSQRGSGTRGPYMGSCLYQFLIWAKLKKNWGPFQKILLDTEKNSSALHKHII